MSKRHKPSYFDDDYDERVNPKRRFTFKSFLQLVAYFLLVIFKAIRDFSVSFREKHPIDELIKNRRKRRGLTFGLCVLSVLIFAIMIGTVMLAVSNENKRISKFNSDAGVVCSEYIKEYGTPNYENMYYSYGVEGYHMTGLCYARELDFNNDNKSELLVCYSDNGVYQAEVWGYVDGDLVQLYHCKAAQTKRKSDDAWVTLYRHNNKYFIGVHSGKKLAKVKLMGMKGDEFVKRYDATYDSKSEIFSIRKKEDFTSFERIKLAVLREEKAAVVLDTVTNTIEGFRIDPNESIGNNKIATRKDAYAEIVSDYKSKFGEPSVKTEEGTSYADGLAFVKLIDLNGDDKNELIVSYRNEVKSRDEDYQGNYISNIEYRYATEVYTFKNKKAVKIFEKEDVSQKQESSDKCVIIQKGKEKNNLCFNSYSSKENDHIVTATSTIYEYNSNEFEESFKAKIITDYGYKEYFVDNEQIWNGTFPEKGYKVPFFDGSSVYSSSEFDVLYLQRSANNSESVQTVVNETKTTIDKLLK